MLPSGRQVEAGAGVVGAGVEIEQRQHVQVGRQQVEDLLVLGEDGQERVAPPGRLAPQDARRIVGVGGDVPMAFGGREDELRVAGDELVRIAPPGRRRGRRADRWRHCFPSLRPGDRRRRQAAAELHAASFDHPTLCTTPRVGNRNLPTCQDGSGDTGDSTCVRKAPVISAPDSLHPQFEGGGRLRSAVLPSARHCSRQLPQLHALG